MVYSRLKNRDTATQAGQGTDNPQLNVLASGQHTFHGVQWQRKTMQYITDFSNSGLLQRKLTHHVCRILCRTRGSPLSLTLDQCEDIGILYCCILLQLSTMQIVGGFPQMYKKKNNSLVG